MPGAGNWRWKSKPSHGHKTSDGDLEEGVSAEAAFAAEAAGFGFI